jgi:hypothetical protein
MNALNARKLTSMFVKRDDALVYVSAASIFRRVSDDDTTETARIEAVYVDPSGIPHVRYHVTFERPNCAPHSEGPRDLALRAFMQNFS